MSQTLAMAEPKAKPTRGAVFWTDLKKSLVVMGIVLAVLWGLEAFDFVLGGYLDRFGIRPRRLDGLSGILFAPFLHGGFAHLAANSSVLVVFGGLILLRSRKEFALVSVITTLLGGLGVWLLGSLFSVGNAVHIGASGVIFGYFGYLLSMGIFERKVGSILLSVALAVGYGGVIFGVLPGQEGVSWESHLFGFLAGVLCARFVGRKARQAAKAKSNVLATDG